MGGGIPVSACSGLTTVGAGSHSLLSLQPCPVSRHHSVGLGPSGFRWCWLPVKSDEVPMVFMTVNAFILVDVEPESRPWAGILLAVSVGRAAQAEPTAAALCSGSSYRQNWEGCHAAVC